MVCGAIVRGALAALAPVASLPVLLLPPSPEGASGIVIGVISDVGIEVIAVAIALAVALALGIISATSLPRSSRCHRLRIEESERPGSLAAICRQRQPNCWMPSCAHPSTRAAPRGRAWEGVGVSTGLGRRGVGGLGGGGRLDS